MPHTLSAHRPQRRSGGPRGGVIRYDQRLGLSGEFRDRSFYNRPYSYTQFSVKVRTYGIAQPYARLDSYFFTS